MRKLTIVLALLFVSAFVSAEKFYDAKIILRDGSALHGLATLPGNPGPSVLRFKEDKKAKSHYVYSDSIKTVIYDLQGTTLEYDVLNLYTTLSHKMVKQWFLEVKQRGPVTLYTWEDPDVIEGVGFHKVVFSKCWACCRQGESIASTIAGEEWKNKRGAFNGEASEYFKDDPALVAKINSNEYKWDDMEKIVEQYNRDKQ